jgi:hypothetical protein
VSLANIKGCDTSQDEASASSMGLLREGPYARQSASTENIMEFIHRWIEAVS